MVAAHIQFPALFPIGGQRARKNLSRREVNNGTFSARAVVCHPVGASRAEVRGVETELSARLDGLERATASTAGKSLATLRPLPCLTVAAEIHGQPIRERRSTER